VIKIKKYSVFRDGVFFSLSMLTTGHMFAVLSVFKHSHSFRLDF